MILASILRAVVVQGCATTSYRSPRIQSIVSNRRKCIAVSATILVGVSTIPFFRDLNELVKMTLVSSQSLIPEDA